jgi:secreted PhoX family phosphatase
MDSIDRRTLLRRGAVLAGTALVAPSVLASRAQATTVGYGPLAPVGDGLLALPAGFTYRVVDRTGDPMSDGLTQPEAPDGQAFFPHPTNRKLWRVVRNHEVGAGTPLGDQSKAYDPAAAGSVVVYDLDPATLKPVDKFLAASGLIWPCSGGATPRKTWLSCEEGTGFTGTAALPKKHGYVFEIPSSVNGQITPVPLKAMGRFLHESAVTDPKTGIVYMTEDDTPAGFYRFVPTNKDDLTAGGTLQMLGIAGQPGYDTRKHQTAGRDLRTTWITIPTPDPDIDGGGPAARVANQGIALGAAAFDYLEGADFRNGAVTFASSYGGDNNHGQIWRYTPSTGRLRMLYETHNRAILDAPDNVAVSPRGGVLICEDGYPRNHLRGLTPDGQIFDFAENLLDGGGSEFAGPAYAPDGKWLLVAIQRPGITLAITGPWGSGQL